jgi:hypothetical protein
MLFAAFAAGLAIIMMMPTVAAAQRHYPGHGPGWGGHVYVGGYWGYPYYSPFWGFYPWYSYGWGPYWGGYWGGYDPTGSVRLEVMPKDTQVFVDGYYVGIVDDFDGTFQRLHAAPGGHELVLWLEGYRTVHQSFYLTTGKDFKVAYAMVKLAPGEAAEPRPTPVERPNQHAYPPRGMPHGYAPPPEQPGQPEQAAPPRQPRQPGQPAPPAVSAEARGFGTLSVRVQPADAEVVVDGDRWRGPDAEERLLIQLAEGSHRVEIQKSGFVTFSTEIQVRAGETANLNVSLPPRNPQ